MLHFKAIAKLSVDLAVYYDKMSYLRDFETDILIHTHTYMNIYYPLYNNQPVIRPDSRHVIGQSILYSIQEMLYRTVLNKSFQRVSNIRPGPSCFELDQYGEDCISIVMDSSYTRKQ